MTSLESGGNEGALISALSVRYDRFTLERALRSTWNLRRRPRVGGAERQIRFPVTPAEGADGADHPATDQLGDDQVAERWLRGLVPANTNQPVTITFESWYSRLTGTEMLLDAGGTLSVANLPVVHKALKIIHSGHSVVVQVRSGPDGPEQPASGERRTAVARQIIRVWVFNGDSVQAVEAATLERNRRVNARGTVPSRGDRFATGWVMTGEPGGARAD